MLGAARCRTPDLGQRRRRGHQHIHLLDLAQRYLELGYSSVEFVLRDCTLVPGLSLQPDGSAVSPGTPSLIVEHPFAKVTLERCITGPISIVEDAEITLTDCIVDASSPDAVAFAGLAAGDPGATLTASECTLVGKVHARLIELASNCIFFARLGQAPPETWQAPVLADRRQEG